MGGMIGCQFAGALGSDCLIGLVEYDYAAILQGRNMVFVRFGVQRVAEQVEPGEFIEPDRHGDIRDGIVPQVQPVQPRQPGEWRQV